MGFILLLKSLKNLIVSNFYPMFLFSLKLRNIIILCKAVPDEGWKFLRNIRSFVDLERRILDFFSLLSLFLSLSLSKEEDLIFYDTVFQENLKLISQSRGNVPKSGVECKSHNSSCSKMRKAEQSWSAGAELVNITIIE